MNPEDPRPRKRWPIVLVIAGVLVAGLATAGWLVSGGSHRCPPGQEWVDQGDGPQAYRGCVPYGAAVKPIIYLYPSKPSRVSVTLSRPDAFTVEYPAYGDGWQVDAKPNGTLRDVRTGRELYALYYETERAVPATVRADGFVVARGDATAFLEEKLAILGLSPREAEEFIVYWLPILTEHPYSYIRFETAEEIAANQVLKVTPRPDTTIRVMMTYRPLETPFEVRPQPLTTVVRRGFTVVEWGGSRIG